MSAPRLERGRKAKSLTPIRLRCLTCGQAAYGRGGRCRAVYVSYVPNVGDKTAPLDLKAAADYHLTPHGRHPNAPNEMVLISLSNMVPAARQVAFEGASRS